MYNLNISLLVEVRTFKFLIMLCVMRDPIEFSSVNFYVKKYSNTKRVKNNLINRKIFGVRYLPILSTRILLDEHTINVLILKIFKLLVFNFARLINNVNQIGNLISMKSKLLDLDCRINQLCSWKQSTEFFPRKNVRHLYQFCWSFFHIQLYVEKRELFISLFLCVYQVHTKAQLPSAIIRLNIANYIAMKKLNLITASC